MTYRAMGVNGIHLYALNKWKDVSAIIDRAGPKTLHSSYLKLIIKIAGGAQTCPW